MMLDGFLPVPADRAAAYREAGYWTGETLDDLARGPAATDPDRTALVAGTRRMSYGELDREADRLAGGLLGLGLSAGDRAVVQLPNVVEFAVTCLPMFRAGVVPVFALPDHRRVELIHLARLAGAVAYVGCDAHRGTDMRRLAAELVEAVPEVRHVLIVGEPGPFTSWAAVAAAGRRRARPPGPRRGGVHAAVGGHHRDAQADPADPDDYAHQLRICAEVLDHDERSVYLAAQSVAHNAALGCPGLLGTLRVGGTTVLAASPSPDEAFALIAAEGVTLTTLMPPVVALWLEIAPDYGVDLSWTVLQVGSARFAPELAARVGPELGSRLSHWFGMAEGLLTCTRTDDPPDVVAGTQGIPLSPGDELRVVDATGSEVVPGEVGELLTRGPCTLAGYFRADEANALAFTDDGFLRTGDLVRITAAGDLVVEGRTKDVVNRGGEKFTPGEVEDHLNEHPALREVVVVPVPDRVLGEKSCAVAVSVGPAPTLLELRVFLQRRGLAAFKLPDQLEFVDALPLTRFGKVDKPAVRRALAAL